MATYKIVRWYAKTPTAKPRAIKTGLTLEEAQAYCRDPETSYKTCTSAAAKRRTRERGPWFDGYTKE